ncbi:DNA-binding protein [Stieleria mannarensis]|uniref:DNA-binding protein n=1 Tax=Stieleria mannarensis TaxID=2755585 RepID=UPI0015FF6A18|nr:DNA-binding protein [Rhodopirellula sp. JC639]
MSKTTKSKRDIEAQLVAGGMLPIKAKVDPKTTEKVVARTYTGAVLGDRKIVRLGAERLGPAEDLAMEFLGLEPAGESKPLAIQARRALGFASWALITHPENAKDALVLVKRIKAAARKAKSKPGHAWDAFTEMAEELNRSVRHFLPPFWEEAARIFKELGNQTYAGRGLGKALEAERVHALDVDRERRRDAVLEFALSGCLSGRALGEYTKDLEQQFEPDEAFETFRDLLVRRTLGGMPPMANAAKDLIRLSKLAGKDPDAEIDRLLKEIISAPSMSRAPQQFWKSVSKRIAHLVKQSDSFGGWLLVHTNCESNYYSESTAWKWIDQLEQWKVLPLLALPAEKFPDDVDLPGGRAGWFSRLAMASTPPPKRFFELLESAADALRDEGVPLQLGKSQGWASVPADVDVIEACLDLNIPLADIDQGAGIGFAGWMQGDVDHSRRNSSLTHVLDDERFSSRVRTLIPKLICRDQSSRRHGDQYGHGGRRFDQAAAGHDALKDIWWQFLDYKLSVLETGGLADFELTLNQIRSAIGRSTIEQFPEVLKRLKKLDLVGTLQRTIAGGILDEYGWKPLDDADDASTLPMIRSRRRDKFFIESFPTLIFVRDGKIEEFGPAGYKVRAEYAFTKSTEPYAILPVGDDTVVVYQDTSNYEAKICWLSDPKDVKKLEGSYWHLVPEYWMPLQDGVFFGSRLLKPGDTKLPTRNDWLSDGQRCWILKVDPMQYQVDGDSGEVTHTTTLQEIDPVTGKKLRESVPGWFEPDLSANATVRWPLCFLMPTPEGLEASPLGSADGLLGWSVRTMRDGSTIGRGIDGRTCTLQPGPHGFENAPVPIAMMDKPGSDSHWVITAGGTVIDAETGIGIALLQEKANRYRIGQPMNLSHRFFHHYTVRCKQASAKLRKISTKQAKVLLEAGRAQHQAHRKKKEEAESDPNREAVVQAVEKWLPDAPPRLQKGLGKIVSIMAAEQASLASFLERITAPPKDEAKPAESKETQDSSPTADGLSDLTIRWPGSNRPDIHRYGNTGASKAHIEVVTNFFETGNQQKIPPGNPDWISVIDDPCAAAWKWFWMQSTIGADNEATQNAPAKARFLTSLGLRGLAYLAQRGILDWKGKFVYYIAKGFSEADAKRAENKPYAPQRGKAIAFTNGKHRYVAYALGGYGAEEIHVLEYIESGNPKPPKPYAILEAIPLRRGWGSKQVQAFVDAVAGLETLPLIEPELLAAAAEQLGASPVQVGLAWMADLRTSPYGQEKLTKELRSHYGWKLNEIKQAIAGLDGEGLPMSLLSAGLLDDPAGAIGSGKNEAFTRMVQAWKKRRESTVTLPPQAAAPLEHVGFGYPPLDRKAFLQLLSDPKDSGIWAKRKTTFQYATQSNRYQQHILDAVYTPEPPLDLKKVLPQLFDAVGWVNYATPFGDPARRKIPALIQAAREWLDAPETTLPFGATQTTRDWYGENKIDVEATVDQFSKVIAPCERKKQGHYEFDSGLIVGAIYPPVCRLHFRTSKLLGSDDLAMLAAAGKMTFHYEGDGSEILEFARFVLEMRSDIADELIAWNQGDALPDGTWEQAPLVSVPDLVARVAKDQGISDAAACLYLQILALPDPTAKNVQAWNGWKPAEYKKIAAELVEKKLVVSAKRGRAGRDIFLPGGWEPLKLPNLPVETWKLSMYGHDGTGRLRGGTAALLVCTRPVASQFRFAYDRVTSGDAPRYEETLQTTS